MRMSRRVLVLVACGTAISCTTDHDLGPVTGSGPIAARTVAPAGVGRLDLVPVAPPGNYLARGACTQFLAKAMSTGFPPVWLVDELITWTTSTPTVIAFDGVTSPPRTSTATHRSGDNVTVCGLGDGYGQIAAQTSGGLPSNPPAFDIDVGRPPVSKVIVDGPSSVHDNASPVQLTALAQDPSGTIRDRTSLATWRSSDDAIASVGASGLLTPHKKGLVTVTGTVYTVSNQLPINILGVQSVTVSPSPASVRLGATLQLAATAKDVTGLPFTGKTATWSSANAGIATVSSSGVVTGIAKGQVTITATIDGVPGTASVTVLGVQTVTVTPSTGSVRIAEPLPLSATAKDINGVPIAGRPVTWTSSAPAVATVSANGLVTGVSEGQVTISATVDGVVGTAQITILERRLNVYVDGPRWINQFGIYAWTASVSGGRTPYTYRWEINYQRYPTWGAIGSNSNRVSFTVDPNDGSFQLRLTVTSASGQQSVQDGADVTVTGGTGCETKIICDP